MEQAAQRFFSTPFFAVVGASQDTRKFGYTILSWYHNHNLPVTPINPSRSNITIQQSSSTSNGATIQAVPSVSALPDPKQTALSFLTPPPTTAKVLEEAHRAGVQAVWLQPGSFGDSEMKFAKEHFESCVGGFEKGTRGGEGWCVLVDGERLMKQVGRNEKDDREGGRGGKL